MSDANRISITIDVGTDPAQLREALSTLETAISKGLSGYTVGMDRRDLVTLSHTCGESADLPGTWRASLDVLQLLAARHRCGEPWHSI